MAKGAPHNTRTCTVGVLALLAMLAGAVAIRVAAVNQGPCAALPCTIPLSQIPTAMLVDAPTGRAFITTVDGPTGAGRVQVLDTGTWQQVGSFALGTGARASALDERAGRVFVAYENARMRVVDVRSGRLLRTITLGRWPAIPFLPFAMGLVVDELAGRVFVTSYTTPGHVSVLDARSGRVLYTIHDGGFSGIAVDGRTGRLFLSNPNGTSVRVLDAVNGRVVSTTAVGGNPGVPVVDPPSGHVFVPIASGDRVSMLDARTGTLLRTVTVGLFPLQAVADERTGRIIVTSGDGSVSVLQAHSGRLLHRFLLSGTGLNQPPGPMAVDEAHGRIIVATQDPESFGRVIVLDERSGDVLHTFAVGGAVVALSVDQRSGRAYVLSENTNVPMPDAWGWLPPWLRRRLPFLPQPGPRTRTLPGSVTVLDASR